MQVRCVIHGKSAVVLVMDTLCYPIHVPEHTLSNTLQVNTADVKADSVLTAALYPQHQNTPKPAGSSNMLGSYQLHLGSLWC